MEIWTICLSVSPARGMGGLLCGSAICCAVAQVVTHLRADELPLRHNVNTRVAAASLKNLKAFI